MKPSLPSLLLVTTLLPSLAFSQAPGSAPTDISSKVKALFGGQTPPAAPASPDAVPQPAPSTNTPLTQPREAVVRCLWFRGGGKTPAEGGTSPVTIRVSPNPTGSTPVAIAQDFVHSAGETWQAASWIAAFCASHAADTLINDHEFLVKAGGFIDGPSAGMLLTATMTALLRGDPILPNVAMTGTVNPDGSAGPVGGIVQKMEGAKKDGIKRMGFPMGCRICMDVNTKQPVDLMEKAKELGIEAVEIGDLYDAYVFLTGKALPRPVPVDESKMQIPIALALRVRGATLGLRSASEQRVEELKRAFATLNKPDRERQESELQPVLAMLARAELCEGDGNLALAFSYAQKADAQSRLAKLMYEMGNHVTRGDKASYHKVGTDQGNATLASMDSLRLSLKAGLERTTVGGTVDALHSYMIYWQGRALADAGIATYRQFSVSGKKLDEVMQKRSTEGPTPKSRSAEAQAARNEQNASVLEETRRYVKLAEEATARFAYAQCRAEAAARWSNFAQESGKTVRVRPDLYEKLGRAYSTAASAGLGWFEAMFLTGDAENLGTNNKTLSNVLVTYDADYGPIYCAAHFAEGSAASGTKEVLAPLDQLASGVYAYHGAARLINKRYNYRTIKGSEEAGRMELTQRKALGHALDLARRRVLEECGRVEALAGFIPDSIRLNYDLANVLRDGSDSDKLNSLTAYWTCVFLCDLTRMLSAEK
jgi:predicted S18 family serine protease